MGEHQVEGGGFLSCWNTVYFKQKYLTGHKINMLRIMETSFLTFSEEGRLTRTLKKCFKIRTEYIFIFLITHREVKN